MSGKAGKATSNGKGSTGKKAEAARVTSSAAAGARGSGSGVWRTVLLAALVVLAGVAYQQWSGDAPVAAPAARDEPSPAVSVQSETFTVGGAAGDDDSVEHVHISLKANPEPEQGGLELDVAERADAPAVDLGAYIQHVESVWATYVDSAPAEPKIELSADPATRRLESIALLLQDHAGVVEFMSFPANPETLRQSPSIKALEPERRAHVLKRAAAQWRERVENYFALQRAATAFRDQLWALVGDFETDTKLTPKAFLALSPMERQVVAKQVPADAELFGQVAFTVRSHMFWEFLDEHLTSKSLN